MPGPITPFADAVATWDRQAKVAELVAAEILRTQVVERYRLAD